MSIAWRAAGATDVGRVREGNEDSLFVDPGRGIFAVADGMGGHAAGEIASSIAATTLGEVLTSAIDEGHRGETIFARLKLAFLEARAKIEQHGRNEPQTRGMGTTLTALVLSPDGAYHLAHLGDSRAYRLWGGRLEQLTRDHTWVQREVEAGRLTAQAARTHKLAHIITRVLGAGTDDVPDLVSGTVHPGDVLLLASDGLTGMLTDAEIATLLGSTLPLPERAAALIRAANERGGTDNITVVVVGVGNGK